MPPRIDSDGDQRPAQITVQPWGPEIIDPENFDPQNPPEPKPTHITMFFSVEEADALARKLVEVELAAKEGVNRPGFDAHRLLVCSP